MKYWYHNSGQEASFYYEPLNWGEVISLFEEDCTVSIEHFIGTDKKQQTFYKSWHGCSTELIAMQKTLKLKELAPLVEGLELYPYEYILRIRNVRIERAILEGAAFTGDPKTIQMLRDRMLTPEAIRKSSINGELVAFGESGKVQVEGTFGNSADLLEFIYNNLMSKESPGYHDFMDSLDSATIVKD
ncbi:MAG: hypothetical protein IPJ66_11695 [Bacteroidetes bacterium]|nr:hypothetical protein [Bacteroidota bacterium]